MVTFVTGTGAPGTRKRLISPTIESGPSNEKKKKEKKEKRTPLSLPFWGNSHNSALDKIQEATSKSSNSPRDLNRGNVANV
jgi:hypothetical protein